MLRYKELVEYDDDTLDFIFENLPNYTRKTLEQNSKEFDARLMDKYNKLKYRQFESKFYTWVASNFAIKLWDDSFVDIINYSKDNPTDFGYNEKLSKVKDTITRSLMKNRKLIDAERLCDNAQLKMILTENIEFYIKHKDTNESEKYWRIL